MAQSEEELLDEYAIRIEGGEQVAKEVARLYELDFGGQIGSLDDYYSFKISKKLKETLKSDADYKRLEQQLESNSNVKKIERQKKLIRVKRSEF